MRERALGAVGVVLREQLTGEVATRVATAPSTGIV
jgi:hypothetical protein